MSYPRTTAFYPVDQMIFDRRFRREPSLEDRCYDMVLSNARLKEWLDPVCHAHLYPGIMAAAMMKVDSTNRESICHHLFGNDFRDLNHLLDDWVATSHVLEHLVKTWSRRKFTLRELRWHVDDQELGIFAVGLFQDHDLHDAVKKPVVDIFFDRFNSKTSPLRELDFRGYPLAGPWLRCLLENILSTVQKCQIDAASRSSGDASMQESVLDVYVDCRVYENDLLQLLCRVLELNSTPSPAVRLHVSTYESEYIDCKLALETLNPEDLTGLCLQYNESGYDGQLGLLKRFHRLRSLSLKNDFSSDDPKLCTDVRDVLMALPILRLDLSQNFLKDCVPLIFGQDVKLEYLDLSWCNLSNSDLTCLAEASFLGSLRELKLSCNTVLSEEFPVTLRLLELVASSLQVLDIEECGFAGSQLKPLVKCILRMCRLVLLYICNDAFIYDSVYEFVPSLAELPNFVCVEFLDDERNRCTYLTTKTKPT